DASEDLPRQAPPAPEGRGPPRCVGRGRDPGSPTSRARRGAAGNDPDEVRGRAAGATPAGSGLGRLRLRLRCGRALGGRGLLRRGRARLGRGLRELVDLALESLDSPFQVIETTELLL